MVPIQFPDALDNTILQELYADDVNYATLMFELFLSEIVPQVYELKQVAEQQNWPLFRQISHKIKPTFGMVGITQMEHWFDKLEAAQDLQSATEIIDVVHTKLAQVLPVIHSAHTHLKSLQDEN
ncbi:Hpt domain-containing protein [Telluribacter sp. SYSU D00476]|uniref:Hpt domain-containing protein n=1 Tax=Telluribacter sp. SYSU D00476 TaxID=2811430 RepID=UPI001FF2E50C|nr:Hpt domain-containing protein [Telluribacter sp. SYSU D00476]